MEYIVILIALVIVWKLIKTEEAKVIGQELTTVTVSGLKAASNVAKSGEIVTRDWLEESLIESVELSAKLEARLAKTTLGKVKAENDSLNEVDDAVKTAYEAELEANMAKLKALRKGL